MSLWFGWAYRLRRFTTSQAATCDDPLILQPRGAL